MLVDPTPEQIEHELRERSHAYWQHGGNGEAVLNSGPGDPAMWIKQPEPGEFFLTYSHPPANWLVPYRGGECETVVEDERGGDPFLIPRACLVGTEEAVNAVLFFLKTRRPTTTLTWQYWHDLPLSEETLRHSGGA